MHSRDCSQVQRLARIYRLRSSSQGSVKKRFVTLIGPVDDDADFSVIDVPHAKMTSGGRNQVSLASQPVSFVSSGVMPSETTEISPVNLAGASENGEEHVTLVTSESFGAFEVHTRGFGSKMMARMGFIEGQGLGKGGTGLAEPIEVIKCPKSLIRMSFPDIGAFGRHTRGFGSRVTAKMGFVEGMGLGKDSQGIVNPLAAVRLPKSRGLGATG
ncbi:hypothetical protein EUGRSUZ_L03201 [Eucalyptus grandis]|uniref:G-patch domain-containing protein n=1 Tax=Eucalyptus grandis TaxID=71139 RepID=A0AAD9T7Y5_EUCGR|nr:hypothetical protein EUGRSUZ_L03201 [Eucalyptus grandis]